MDIKKLYPKTKLNIEINGITNNPFEVKENYIFVLTTKSKNEHLLIKEAINNKASLIISNKTRYLSIPHFKTKNPKKEYIRLLKLFYHYTPIYTVGVVGNNGNEIITNILNNVFSKFDLSAYINNNEINYLNRHYKTKNYLNTIFPCYKIFNNHNIKNVTINLDNKSIINNDIKDLDLNGIIFSNLEYRYSNIGKELYRLFHIKNQLFTNIKSDTLLIMNADDLYSNFIPKYSKNKIITYGINKGIYQAKNIKLYYNKCEFDVYYKDIYLTNINVPLFGTNNIYNSLAVISYTNELGIPLEIIKDGIESINTKQYFNCYTNFNNITKLATTSTNPYILKNTLLDIKKLKKGKIISIINSNENIDEVTLNDLGVISTTYSDITIFTSSDNIFNNLLNLTNNVISKDYYICIDNNEAIKLADKIVNNNDIILMFGNNKDLSININPSNISASI